MEEEQQQKLYELYNMYVEGVYDYFITACRIDAECAEKLIVQLWIDFAKRWGNIAGTDLETAKGWLNAASVQNAALYADTCK